MSNLFQLLLEELMTDLKCRVVEPVSKLLSVIWLLATEESYRSVADRFGMSKGSLHFHMLVIVEVLASNITNFVTWPTTAQMEIMALENQQHHGFPGCFGYVDGSHIPIKGRRENRESYINRMGYSSVLLQGVCNSNMEFIHAYAGWPGSIHDARMFRNSDLSHLLPSVPKHLHLLGDSAYPLSHALMTPFRDHGKLTVAQKKYNVVHGAARSVIERSFALLKGKFRRLKYLDMSLDMTIPSVVMSCVGLHNFILRNENWKDSIDTIPLAEIDALNIDASTKRNTIAASL